MSILINGMEMPTSCKDCPLAGDFKCNLMPSIPALCKEYDMAVQNGKRLNNCPLVELPPHGDLIDRDALIKSLDRLCDRVCQYSKAQRKVMCSACPLGDAFAVVEDDAPTIIEAEEGET